MNGGKGGVVVRAFENICDFRKKLQKTKQTRKYFWVSTDTPPVEKKSYIYHLFIYFRPNSPSSHKSRQMLTHSEKTRNTKLVKTHEIIFHKALAFHRIHKRAEAVY